MKLSELESIVLVESGQFLLGSDLSAVTLNSTKFWVMVHRALAEYGRWRPIEKQSQVTVNSFTYTFTSSGIGVPDWVSSAIPVNSIQNPLGVVLSPDHDSLTPSIVLWEYRSPTLYVSEAGIFDIISIHKHSYVVSFSSGTNVSEVDMPEITNEDVDFINLVVARFLIAVGKSRRAFTISPLPIESDASEMVSEGNELYDRTMENLKENNSKWWEAVG